MSSLIGPSGGSQENQYGPDSLSVVLKGKAHILFIPFVSVNKLALSANYFASIVLWGTRINHRRLRFHNHLNQTSGVRLWTSRDLDTKGCIFPGRRPERWPSEMFLFLTYRRFHPLIDVEEISHIFVRTHESAP
jgi:hypothetical protein